MSQNSGMTMGLGLDVEGVDWRNMPATMIPFHPSVTDGLDKLVEVTNKMYSELSACPLKSWKERLVAVWGKETL